MKIETKKEYEMELAVQDGNNQVKPNSKEWISVKSILPSLYELRKKLRDKRISVPGLGNLQARLDIIIKEIEK